MTPSELSHEIRFPGESDEYRRAREDLLRAEIALRAQEDAVAEQRRSLPLGGAVPQDYEFQEWDTSVGAPRGVRLSELFEDGKDSLFLYSFMFLPTPDGNPIGRPCPACTSIIDAVSGQARHVSQRTNLAVSAKAPIEHLQAHAHSRGWNDIRLLSSGQSTYNSDYHAEDPDRGQLPVATVFVRRDGVIHHLWTSELMYGPPAPGQHPRHVDFMWPVWKILDTVPEGRGDYDLALEYK